MPDDFTLFEEKKITPITNPIQINMKSKKPYIKPNSFSGTTSENFETFLKKYNRKATINGWTKDDNAQFLVAFLEGSALQFYENNECNAVIPTKWPILESKLRAEFEPIA